MYLFGYSLDNLSLMALTISTGFVVDDAIVVIENISRHLEQGDAADASGAERRARSRFHRAFHQPFAGGGVYPILLMGGIVGRLFREFAVTLSTAILVSLVISLTTTPMMCARLLRQIENRRTHGTDLPAQAKRSLRGCSEGYERSLQVVLRHPAITLGVLIATIAANGFSLSSCRKDFFRSRTTARLRRNPGFAGRVFQAMQGAALQVCNTIKTDPAVAAVVAFTGGTARPTAVLFTWR